MSIEKPTKNILLKFILIGFISLSFFTSKAQTIDTLKINESLSKLLEELKEDYVFYDEKDIDFDCIESYYRNKILEIKNGVDAFLLFEYLLDEFYDSHLHLQANIKQSYRLFSPLYTETKGNKTKILCTWKSQINEGVNRNIINGQILTFNGKDFNDMIADFPTHCQNKNNDEVRTWLGNKILAGRYNEPRIITIKNSSGQIDTLDLDKIKIRKDSTLVSYQTEDNIGIIRINNSLGTNKTKRVFKRVLKNMKNTKGVILDLRNTIDGGDTYVANPIAGHFTTKKVSFQKYRNSKKSFDDYIKPKRPIYKKDLIILVNHWTGSVGEGLASGFNGAGIGRVIGTKMAGLAGATKSNKIQHFSYGYQYPYIRVLQQSGMPREQFIPKYEIDCNCQEEDEFIRTAIEMINGK